MEDDAVVAAIPEAPGPRTDRPGAEDPHTRVVIRFVYRGLWRGVGGCAGMCALAGIVAFFGREALAAITLFIGLALALLFFLQLTLLRAVDKAMAAQAWRPVIARPLRATDCRVEVRDGADLYYLKGGVLDPFAQVLARHPRAWLVGPDSRGRAALRLPGTHSPLPLRKAKNADGYREVRPRQTNIDPAAPASEDEVAIRWAKVVRRKTRRWFCWPALLALAVSVGFLRGASDQTAADEASMSVAVAVAVGVLVLLIWALSRWQKGRDAVTLPKLLAAGPWQRYPIRLTSPYRPGKFAFGDVSVAVEFDGVEHPFTLHYASPDVVGYIENTGTIWFAGSPHSGGQAIAVGVPGYPIIGIVRPAAPESR